MKFLRALTLFVGIIFSTVAICAQSSGDKLYNQGLALQKTMTVAAQNQAISKFNSAKKLYDSAAKKAQCDQAISVSRNIISSLKGGGGRTSNGRGTKDQTTTQEPVTPTLEISNSEFNIDLESRVLNVTVSSNQSDWTVSPVACSDGSSFLRANKLGDNGFEIIVPENETYESRTQNVIVSAGGLKREVSITQTGLRVNIEVSKQLLTFKKKGQSQKIDVLCNSDVEYEENDGANWYVESKPDWIVVTINEKRESGLWAKVKDTGSKLKEKSETIVNGKTKSQLDNTLKKVTVSVTADPNSGGSERVGDVVIRSGDSTVAIHVTQQ